MSPRATFALGVVLLAAMAAFCALRFKTTSDITHFLPSGADRREAALSRALAGAELARSMILTVGAPDPPTAAAATRALAARLRRHPEVAWVRAGLDEGAQRALYDLYFPRRFYHLSARPEAELPARLSDAGLADAARALKRQLVLPTAPMVARLAGADPLLAFTTHVERLRASQEGTLRVVDGQFVTADGRHGVAFLATRASPFEGARQARVLAAVRRAFDAEDRARGGALTLEQSGLNRFARASESAIRADMSRISTLSAVGVVLLFLLAFGTLRSLGATLLPVAAGLVAGATAGLLAFGQLHGLTLAFGATLIGVCFDYPILLLCHHTLHPAPGGPVESMRRVWMALLLAAVTTVAGFAGMAGTAFPGLREMAVFASVGVLAALAATRWMVPALAPARPAPAPRLARAADALYRALELVERHARASLVLVAAALAVCALGLPRLRWVDDLAALTPQSPELLAEDARVRARVSRVEGGRFVVALGRDLEDALRANDAVAARLAAARAAGELEDYRSLHDLLWSADLQRRNLAQLRAAPDLAARVARAFAREGFRAEAFRPFAAALAADPPPPLTYDDLVASPVGPVARTFRVQVGTEVAVLTHLRGVRDPAALERRLAGVGRVFLFDQQRFLRATYGRYRERTLALIALGLVAVFAVVWARYRTLRRALAAFAPAVLAAGASLGALALVGAMGNLLHLVGLLLVLSMGVDYGVAMVECAGRREELGAALLALVLACGSTVLSFGLLALSTNPALRALGLTTSVGMVLSFVLAPLALVLLGATKPRG